MASEIAKKYGKEMFQRYGNPCTSVEAKEVAVAKYVAFVQSTIDEATTEKDAEIERLENLVAQAKENLNDFHQKMENALSYELASWSRCHICKKWFSNNDLYQTFGMDVWRCEACRTALKGASDESD